MDTFKRKTEVINEGFTTYAEASHSSKVLGKYGAQTVTVIEEKIAGFVSVQIVVSNGLIKSIKPSKTRELLRR